jgi:plasmid stability protein
MENTMAQVLIRDVAPSIVESLKARAHRNRRSLEAELRVIVEKAAQEDVMDSVAEVNRVRAMFAGRSFDDSSELVREDRDR